MLLFTRAIRKDELRVDAHFVQIKMMFCWKRKQILCYDVTIQNEDTR